MEDLDHQVNSLRETVGSAESVCNQLRGVLSEMVEWRQGMESNGGGGMNGKQQNGGGGGGEVETGSLSLGHQSSVASLLATLRGLHREAYGQLEGIRSVTSSGREAVDVAAVSAAGLSYQVAAVTAEVERVKRFQSAVANLELFSVDEFEASAPVSLKTAIPGQSSAEVTHQMTLNRLAWELAERKRLVRELAEVERRSTALAAANAAQSAFLGSLSERLRTLAKAAAPLQTHLGLPISRALRRAHSAAFLPTPLYMVFTQASAFAAASQDSVSVAVFGKLSGAQLSYVSALEAATRQGAESGDLMGVTGVVAAESVRGTAPLLGSVAVSGSESAAELYAPHALGVQVDVWSGPRPGLGEGTEATAAAAGGGGGPESVLKLSLAFWYHPKLNVISVKAYKAPAGGSGSGSIAPVPTVGTNASGEVDEDVLVNLVPNDTGEVSPNPANGVLIGGACDDAQSPAMPWRLPNGVAGGLPYKWAQWLGGLDFHGVYEAGAVSATAESVLPSSVAVGANPQEATSLAWALGSAAAYNEGMMNASLGNSSTAMKTPLSALRVQVPFPRVVQAILSRIEARSSLSKALMKLNGGRLPDVPVGSVSLPRPSASLSEWRPVNWASLEETIGAETLSELGSGSGWQLSRARCFQAAVGRDGYNLECFVIVPIEYPWRMPWWHLRWAAGSKGAQSSSSIPADLAGLADKSALASIRGLSHKAVDVNLVGIAEELNVFVGQYLGEDERDVLALQVRLLLTLLDVYVETERGGREQAYGKLAIRNVRGKMRLKPFVWSPAVGLFSQRT